MSAPVPALELRDVHAGYGRIEVLHGVSFVVPAGCVFALLGPNGAGKSTTLLTIGGMLTPTSGCVHVAGTHVNGVAPEKLARAGACRIPEGRGIFPNLTVAENLRIWTYAADQSAAEVEAKAFERFPVLGQRRTQVAGTLSGGEQQMLALSRALVSDPEILVLDEISMGLAPLIVTTLYEVVAQLAASGITVIVVEQFARTALAVADYAAVMTQGRISALGEPADIQDVIQEAYLGGVA